jgi:hypothetical protein
VKTLISMLVLTAVLSAQQPCPLAVVKVNPARTRWVDGTPREMTVEVQNVSDKEEAVAQYVFTYTDKLGHITDMITGEPVMVHESGHKTLRPGRRARRGSWRRSCIPTITWMSPSLS